MKKIYSLSFCFSILFVLMSMAAIGQLSGYQYSPLSQLNYTQLAGGTVIDSVSQLSAGQTKNADDGTVLVNLPFSFNYNGSNFTQVTFCTNGWIALGDQTMSVTASQSRTPGNLFNTTIPNNLLAPWFKDGTANFPGPNGIGKMVHGLESAGVYVFEWRNAAGSGYSLTSMNTINYMVKIYGPASTNPGRIEFLYGPKAGSFSANASIGLKDATGGPGNFINGVNGLTNSTALSTVWPGEGNGYRFDPPQPCTGTPVAGTAMSTDTIVCPSKPITLSVFNSSVGSGISYMWQSSTDGTTWMNLTGETGATYSISAGLQSSTYFRRSITCNGNTSVSSIVYVHVNGLVNCYCTTNPNGSSLHSVVGNPHITNVAITGTTLANAHSTVPASGYTQFAASGSTTATLQHGVTYSLATTLSGMGDASAWIDWNRNGLYESAEWTRITKDGDGATILITVPANASIGETGLRIRARTSGNGNDSTTACFQYGSGETEEYIINVIAAQPCSGTPFPGTVSAPASICAGSALHLVTNGTTAASGLTFQWQSSPVAQNNWTNITGATNNAFSTYQSAATDYRVLVSCNAGNAATSNTVSVAMKTTNCPPVNDEPCNAVTLPISADDNCSQKVTGTTDLSTISFVNGYSNPVGCNAASSPKDVWYKVTTTATGAGSTSLGFRFSLPAGTTMTTASMSLFSMTGSCPAPTLTYVTNACKNSPLGTYTSFSMISQ
jgi:hypothetical protein